jgi:hypothetical protein
MGVRKETNNITHLLILNCGSLSQGPAYDLPTVIASLRMLVTMLSEFSVVK